MPCLSFASLPPLTMSSFVYFFARFAWKKARLWLDSFSGGGMRAVGQSLERRLKKLLKTNPGANQKVGSAPTLQKKLRLIVDVPGISSNLEHGLLLRVNRRASSLFFFPEPSLVVQLCQHPYCSGCYFTSLHI